MTAANLLAVVALGLFDVGIWLYVIAKAVML